MFACTRTRMLRSRGPHPRLQLGQQDLEGLLRPAVPQPGSNFYVEYSTVARQLLEALAWRVLEAIAGVNT